MSEHKDRTLILDFVLYHNQDFLTVCLDSCSEYYNSLVFIAGPLPGLFRFSLQTNICLSKLSCIDMIQFIIESNCLVHQKHVKKRFDIILVFTQSQETQKTIDIAAMLMPQTKEITKILLLRVHQHGRHDVR